MDYVPHPVVSRLRGNDGEGAWYDGRLSLPPALRGK